MFIKNTYLSTRKFPTALAIVGSSNGGLETGGSIVGLLIVDI